MSKTNQLNLAPFDASDHLDSEEVIAEYLTVALEDPHVSLEFRAVEIVESRDLDEDTVIDARQFSYK